MESATGQPERPQHRRSKSSKSALLRSLVSSKSRTEHYDSTSSQAKVTRTQTMPLLPADHPHAKVLGERHSNVQSPPSSPSKRTAADARNGTTTSAPPRKSMDDRPKKSRSTVNLAGVFSKMNRSSKDLSALAPKEKENKAPPSSADSPTEAPIWAQFSSTSSKSASRPSSRDSKQAGNIEDEIAKYTPRDYSPSKQRNFNGTLDQPGLRPTLGKSRPQSAVLSGTAEGIFGAIGRRVSSEIAGRRSEDSSRRSSKDYTQRVSVEKNRLGKSGGGERKVSGSSVEQAPKGGLNIMKRGGRVMAAVAALQGKNKEAPAKPEPELDPKAVDTAFEAVLDSRNVPEPMRQKMRSLTLRVKADFIRQNDGASNTKSGGQEATPSDRRPGTDDSQQTEDDDKTGKRSRPRSRTFTFSKGDKRGDTSPSKKQRSQSKSRPTSILIPKESYASSASTPVTPTGTTSRKGHTTAVPTDYISYLRKNQDPTKAEVGRLHKLRILLRNETVAWVDSFVALGGMAEVVSLLHRTMAVEWREEHEDQLLHETLLCLKGLCTTERAMAELEKVADELFPALLAMLFDDEKKGPAEYTTRTIIMNVLFNFLSSATNLSPTSLERRARRILTYLGEPAKPEDAKPVDFVLGMQVPRPYKLWCREVTHVTREVFWIFLHHLNVVPLPKRPSSADSSASTTTAAASPADSVLSPDSEPSDRAKVLAATYTQRHFPGLRPPVPAAPYIGGVEWDATTYLAAHLDLLNGLVVSLPSVQDRNSLRAELQASGFEKTMGATLRTCKEKFYSGVHDGLRAWVAAAVEDGWETRYVREGPTMEEQAARARSASPAKKKKESPPKLEEIRVESALPKLDLGFDMKVTKDDGDDDGWLG